MNSLVKLTQTKAPDVTVLIRLMAGGAFFLEGVLKFLYPAALGAGRFVKIGIPYPQIMGPFVGSVQMVCGAPVLIGLLTRLAATPLLINISVAILSTKIPILLGHGFWMFTLPDMPHYGFLSMMHEARTSFSMVFVLLFLLCIGAGKWLVDGWLATTGRGIAK